MSLADQPPRVSRHSFQNHLYDKHRPLRTSNRIPYSRIFAFRCRIIQSTIAENLRTRRCVCVGVHKREFSTRSVALPKHASCLLYFAFGRFVIVTCITHDNSVETASLNSNEISRICLKMIFSFQLLLTLQLCIPQSHHRLRGRTSGNLWPSVSFVRVRSSTVVRI